MARTDTTTSGPILTGVYGALTRVFGGLWQRYGGWGWSRIRLMLPSARFDWEREASDTWMSSVVALGLAWLGDRFPRPKINLAKVARNGDLVPVARHPVADLWSRPNQYYSRRTMEKAIGLSLKCDGNAYIYKVRNNLGKVVELWWVPHYRILPTWPADGSRYIDGYRVWLDTAVYHLPPEDVIHIRDGIDPRNERLGLSALRACLREVVTLNFEASFTAALLKNSGVPGIAIVPDGDNGPRPDRDAADRISDRFQEEYSGDFSGRPIVMAGKYKIEQIGFTPEELRLDRLPMSAQARVAASIGVAAMSLGLPDPNKTYSNLEEANRASWGTVVSIQELIAEAVQHQLFPEFGLDPHGYVFQYDYSNIQELQESLDAVHARAREDWKAGGIRLNEYREAIGYEPDPDGDRFFPNTGSEADAAAMEQQAALKQPRPGEEQDDQGVAKGWQPPFSGESPQHRPNGCGCGPGDFKGDYSLPPHPAEYPATVAAFGLYLDDCKAFPGVEVVDDLATWLVKYNHCHGRDGRFCGGSSRGAGGSFSPVGGHGGKPAAGGGGGGGEGSGKPTDLGSASDKEVAAHHESMSKDWHESLGKDEKAAIETYSTNKFTEVNRYLRRGGDAAEDNPQAEGVVRGVDRSLSKARLKEDTVVYRGIGNLEDLGLSESSLKDAVIHEAAFLSTSLSPKAAHEFVGAKNGAVMKITAPKGSKGASMSGLSKYPEEHEVFFARGASLAVTKHYRDKEGRLVIEATLSHSGAKPKSADPDLKAAFRRSKTRLEERFGWQAGDVTITHAGKALALANGQAHPRWTY